MVIAGSSAAKAAVDAAAVAAASVVAAVAGKKRSRPSSSTGWGDEKTHGRSAPKFTEIIDGKDNEKSAKDVFAPMVPEGFGSTTISGGAGGGSRSGKKENYVSIGMPEGIALGRTASSSSSSSASASMEIEEDEAGMQPRSSVSVALEAKIPFEPPLGTPYSVSIQLKMPDASRVLRRFNGADSVASIYQYAALRLMATPQWVSNAVHPLVSGPTSLAAGFDLSRIFPRESLLQKAIAGMSIQDFGRLDKEVLLVTLK
jgi:hypothetical protein